MNFILDFRINQLLHRVCSSIKTNNFMLEKIERNFLIDAKNDWDKALKAKNKQLENLAVKKENERLYFKSRIDSLTSCLESGKRIHIDSDILEYLLFDRVTLDDSCVVKRLVWTGNFLQKIDLSEVSFEDVFWSYDDYRDNTFKEVGPIVLKGTNAKIDFLESFEGKMGIGAVFSLRNCSFKGIDLSNSNITRVFNCFENCDFRNTGVDFDNNYVELVNCDVDCIKGKCLSKNKLFNMNPNSNQS